jgi:hypothetical protein
MGFMLSYRKLKAGVTLLKVATPIPNRQVSPGDTGVHMICALSLSSDRKRLLFPRTQGKYEGRRTGYQFNVPFSYLRVTALQFLVPDVGLNFSQGLFIPPTAASLLHVLPPPCTHDKGLRNLYVPSMSVISQ